LQQQVDLLLAENSQLRAQRDICEQDFESTLRGVILEREEGLRKVNLEAECLRDAIESLQAENTILKESIECLKGRLREQDNLTRLVTQR
jgi:hypothetical protein